MPNKLVVILDGHPHSTINGAKEAAEEKRPRAITVGYVNGGPQLLGECTREVNGHDPSVVIDQLVVTARQNISNRVRRTAANTVSVSRSTDVSHGFGGSSPVSSRIW